MKIHPRKSSPSFIRPRWSPGHRNTAVLTACKSTSLPVLGEKHTDITPSTMSFRPRMWAESRQRQCLISSWKSFRSLPRLFPRVRLSLPYAHSQHNLFHTAEPKIIPQRLKTDLIDEKNWVVLVRMTNRESWTSLIFLPEDLIQKFASALKAKIITYPGKVCFLQPLFLMVVSVMLYWPETIRRSTETKSSSSHFN